MTITATTPLLPPLLGSVKQSRTDALRVLDSNPVLSDMLIKAENEVFKLRQDNRRLRRELTASEKRNRALRIEKRRLVKISYKDPLTKILNRRGFYLELENLIADVDQHNAKSDNKRVIAFAMIDLDHFKKVNDDQGHAKGDAALKKATANIKKHCLGKSNLIARLGGDEFIAAFACYETEATETAFSKAEEIRKSVEDNCPHGITASIGVFIMNPDCSIKQAMRNADNGTYASKKRHRNCVCVMDTHGNVIRETRPLIITKPKASTRRRRKASCARPTPAPA